MPLLTIKTNITLGSKTALAESASLLVANILAKPERYVMVHISDDETLMFAGDPAPCAILELKSLGLDEKSTAEYSAKLCDFMFKQTAINPNRIYIEFSSPERHMWGWNKATF